MEVAPYIDEAEPSEEETHRLIEKTFNSVKKSKRLKEYIRECKCDFLSAERLREDASEAFREAGDMRRKKPAMMRGQRVGGGNARVEVKIKTSGRTGVGVGGGSESRSRSRSRSRSGKREGTASAKTQQQHRAVFPGLSEHGASPETSEEPDNGRPRDP